MESMEITDASAENSQSKPPEKKVRANDYGTETRKVAVPKHRFGPLKENWMKIFNPVVEHLKLQIRFNLKTRNVEIRTGKETENISNVQISECDLRVIWEICFPSLHFQQSLQVCPSIRSQFPG